MSFEFRVSSFGLERRRVAGALSGFAASAKRTLARLARGDGFGVSRGGKPDGKSIGFSDRAQLESQNSEPETILDTDFLRKLERLHLIAKRHNWAGAKGEHA